MAFSLLMGSTDLEMVELTSDFLDVLYRAIERSQCAFVMELVDTYTKSRSSWSFSEFRKAGSTPLICACQHGNLTIVQYLIEKAAFPVGDCGTVRFENEVIEDAPPIWVASAAGHIALVKYLLQKGADVNAVTSTNSTSLRAACFDGHFDIVEYLIQNGANIEIANQHNHTCLMIACFKKHFEIVKVLVKNGAEVNRRSRKGNTALHDCAEGGCTEIMKFLLDNGAVFQKDEYGVSPLMAAAISAHTSVVRFIMDTYITPTCDEESILDEIEKGSRISPTEQIDVLEMLGCSMIDKKQDLMEGLKWWKRAEEMRSLYSAVGLVPASKVRAAPVSEMDHIVEYQTLEDVDNMLLEFDPNYIKMQSLLVRQRLLGFKHPDTTYYIRYRGAVLADMGDYPRCLRLWRYVLKNLVQHLDSLCCNILLCAVQSYVELFGFLFHAQSNESLRNFHPRPKKNLIDVSDVLSVLEACIELYRFHRNVAARSPAEQILTTQNKTEATCMKLICKLVVFFTLVNQQNPTGADQSAERVTSVVSSIVSRDIRDHEGNTLLHVIMNPECCGVERQRMIEYPHLPAIEVMAEVYHSVYCDIDIKNNKLISPLSLFFRDYMKVCSCETVEAVINLFEKFGAHVDNDAQTRPSLSPLVVFNERVCRKNESTRKKWIKAASKPQSQIMPNVKLHHVRSQSLQCLCACALLANNCDLSSLPHHLQCFVMRH